VIGDLTLSTPITDNHETPASSGLPFACDLVLKGGITSGVVYPPAIVELARDHRFHNIGGASAGAIGAVAAAAAEYGRQAGGGGFEGLATIPSDLAVKDPSSGQTTLQRLFVPQPETREYFDLFWQQRKLKGRAVKRIRALLPSLFRHSPWLPPSNAAKLGAFGLPVAAVIWLALDPSPGTIGFTVLAVLVGAAVYVVSRAVAGASNMANDAQKAVADNMHGLCNGRSVGDQIGLTDWLHERIEGLAGDVRHSPDAGQAESPPPLTYGDLKKHDIGLVTLTTNLSQNSSETFPFSDATWAFKPADMYVLFPRPVAAYLEQRGTVATQTSDQRDKLEGEGLLKLPRADELPILFGARVSLSFPVVISAVPLWRLTPVQSGNSWVTEYHEVWLSDGGICSNMPVHLFDRALPSRPTYGINLGSGATAPAEKFDSDAEESAYARSNVWRPIRAGSGALAPIVGISSTTQLLGEVLTTMQNWSDNSMTRALGVRDRICTVRLRGDEGGMNLDMPSETIIGLAPRGRAAGESLGWMVRGTIPDGVDPEIDDDEAVTQWTRHRWTRLRSTACGTGQYVADVRSGWVTSAVPQHGPEQNNLTYAQLAADAQTLSYLPYRSNWSPQAGTDLTAAIEALSAVDFGIANTTNPPPLRLLTLSARSAPETELDE
jgi:hypothetical protein